MARCLSGYRGDGFTSTQYIGQGVDISVRINILNRYAVVIAIAYQHHRATCRTGGKGIVA